MHMTSNAGDEMSDWELDGVGAKRSNIVDKLRLGGSIVGSFSANGRERHLIGFVRMNIEFAGDK